MILLVILVILAALVLFAVWPGAKREDLRAPFYGRNYAHRGYFGKDQRPRCRLGGVLRHAAGR